MRLEEVASDAGYPSCCKLLIVWRHVRLYCIQQYWQSFRDATNNLEINQQAGFPEQVFYGPGLPVVHLQASPPLRVKTRLG